MTGCEMNILHRLSRSVKVWFNYRLDRIIDVSELFLGDAYRFPWPSAQGTAKRVARFIGDVAWLLRDFPRLSATRVVRTDWTIVFVGGDIGLREICHLLLEDNVERQELGRIPLWNLSERTQQWLSQGVDLVVCELSRIHPRPLSGTLAFAVPTLTQQALTIPEPLESLISGKKFATERHRLNKARRAGFSYRFSRSKADFDHFYYRMHLPYVKARHGRLALVSRYEDQWKRWFVRGGVVLVTQQDEPVAGVLCYVANDTCFDIARGVLDADPQLLKQGIETMITWYAMNWARDQGAKIYDMGPLPYSYRADGAFNSKRRWGAQVVRPRRIYGVWTFLAQDLSASLRDHLNRVGFISEIEGKFYGVLLSSDADSMAKNDLGPDLRAVENLGLDGLVEISANTKPKTHSLTTWSAGVREKTQEIRDLDCNGHLSKGYHHWC